MSYTERRRGQGYGGIRNAKKVQSKRSAWAKHIDQSLKAPKAENVDQWLGAPNRFDLPNVDTNKNIQFNISLKQQMRKAYLIGVS